ncbi:MAG TPA: NAD(P)-dependent oxidoreductase [Candidatus Binatia bacterium]|jgi:UDP-glucose 4-epimerase|nr:NAD(P)-dependent oxidoreductase [Candidatus Binatia bacterium]
MKPLRTGAGEQSNPIRRIVILGHTGFIGGNLHSFFRTHSQAAVIVGRSFSDVDLTFPEHAERLSNLFDLNTAVIVCAAIKKQLGDSLEIFSSNLQIVMNLCRVLAKCPVRRVIFFSSAAVYGEDVHNTNITEATPPQPRSYYGLAKFASEILLRKAIDRNKPTSLLILRPALVYGPGDQGGYGPTGFIKAALRREPIVLWGDGSEKREFIFVGDLTRAVHALTFDGYDGIVNVASGQSYSFQDAVNVVQDLVALEQPLGSRPRTKGKADHGFDNSRLRALVPDMQFTSLAEGIRVTFEANHSAANNPPP